VCLEERVYHGTNGLGLGIIWVDVEGEGYYQVTVARLASSITTGNGDTQDFQHIRSKEVPISFDNSDMLATSIPKLTSILEYIG
jgi:hypothetical protein